MTLAVADVGEALGRPLRPVVDRHVQRWGGGLPQYAVGHSAGRPDPGGRRRAAGIEVAGAAYDGVGVPAVIASGRAARGGEHDLVPAPHPRGPR